MEQTNQKQDLESQLAELESQLRECAAAENFFETGSGKLIVELFTKNITRITRDVASQKYLKDFQGYQLAVLELGVYSKILRSIQVAAAPQRRQIINEKIENLQENEG